MKFQLGQVGKGSRKKSETSPVSSPSKHSSPKCILSKLQEILLTGDTTKTEKKLQGVLL